MKRALVESFCCGNHSILVVLLENRPYQVEPAKNVFDVYKPDIIFSEGFVKKGDAQNLSVPAGMLEQNTCGALTELVHVSVIRKAQVQLPTRWRSNLEVYLFKGKIVVDSLVFDFALGFQDSFFEDIVVMIVVERQKRTPRDRDREKD